MLLESFTEGRGDINKLDSQIRDALDFENCEKPCEESDKYLYTILCAKLLLSEKISKMSLIYGVDMTQQVKKDSLSRRPLSAPQIAPVQMLWSPSATSQLPVIRHLTRQTSLL